MTKSPTWPLLFTYPICGLRSIIGLALLTCLTCGCATRQTQPETVSLAPATRNEVIVIHESISFRQIGNGLIKIVVDYGVLPGIYRAENENELGVFYRGPDRPVWRKVVGDDSRPYLLEPGGIWLPKDPSLPPRLYSINAGRPYTTKVLPLPPAASANSSDKVLNQMVTTNRPVGPTAVGSVFGAAIVAAIIAEDIGKTFLWAESGDPRFDSTMRQSLRSPLPFSDGASDVRDR